MNTLALKSLIFNFFLLSVIFIMAGIYVVINKNSYIVLLVGIIFLLVFITLCLFRKKCVGN